MSESLAATNPSSYDAVSTADDLDKNIATGNVPVGTSENAPTNEEFSKEAYAALKKFIAEGDINLRSVGLVAAVGMVVTGFVSCLAHLFDLDLCQAVLDIMVLGCGCILSALEYKESILPHDITDYVHTELHIAVTPYGRSTIYLTIGLILLTQDSWFQGVMGLLLVCLGGFIFNTMKSKIEKLSSMKTRLTNEGELKKHFMKYSDSNGVVESRQVAKLCVDLGSGLKHDELVVALDVLDRSGKGEVNFDDFLVWYAQSKV